MKSPPIHPPPVEVSCRDCGQKIWLHTAQSGKKYPGNSETDRRDFHNCESKQAAKKKGAKFGNEVTTRQLDLDLPKETVSETPVETGSRLIALISFPRSATVADAKAILARLGDDVQKVSITQIVE